MLTPNILDQITINFGVLGAVHVAFTANVDHLITSNFNIKLEEGAYNETGEVYIVRHPEFRSADLPSGRDRLTNLQILPLLQNSLTFSSEALREQFT